jgi:hypothetical protein
MKNSGLPKVSIEYYTMVQTARSYFGPDNSNSTSPDLPAVLPTDADLDKLGLAILIAGLDNRQFGINRTDDPSLLEKL